MSDTVIDRTGDRVGNWTVLERAPNKGRSARWLCRCDCGTEKIVPAQALSKQLSRSCGCLRKDTKRPTSALETNILELHSNGLNNRAIAKQLSIHHNTVQYWLSKNDLTSVYFHEPLEVINAQEARCSRCREIKSISNFQFGRKGKSYEYRFSFCNECRKKQGYLNLNKSVDKFLSDRYNRLVKRSAKLKVPCTITKEDFLLQYHAQKGLCFYSDIEMVCKVGQLSCRHSLSIDKIIPEIGYVKGNVVFATYQINSCKSDLSLNQIEMWMPGWYERIQRFINTEQE